MKLFLPYLLLVYLLSGCATKVSTLEKDVDISLDENYGYLLIGIETNSNLEEILIDGARSIKLTGKDVRKGTQYILVDMPSGNYSIEKIKVNKFWHTELTEGYWDFNVSSGVISYVGHINVETIGWWQPISIIELANRSSEAVIFMEKQYPKILSSRKIIYDGPGEDPFLEYVQKEGWK